jgi:hypothetical protein
MKAKKQKLVLEVNPKSIDMETGSGFIGDVPVMVPPNINEDYWQFRVHLQHDQYIVAFPKFFQIGIGFAQEDSWNTNLPATYKAEQIFDWIKKNKYYASIPDELCIEAIKLVQKVSKEYMKAQKEAEAMALMVNEPMWADEKGNGLTLKTFKTKCHILYSRKTEIFTGTFFGSDVKKKKYCMVFGFNGTGYKYKYTFFEINNFAAIANFYRTVRIYIQTGVIREANWEKFEVNNEFAFNAPRSWKNDKEIDHFFLEY